MVGCVKQAIFTLCDIIMWKVVAKVAIVLYSFCFCEDADARPVRDG